MSTMAVAIYMVLSPTSASAQIKIEQSNLRDLSQAVDRSIGLLGTFEGIDTSQILSEELAPDRMQTNSDLQTHWGAPVSIRSERVFVDHDAFVVTYPQTPSQVCAGLASAMARDAFNIRVNGVSVYDANGLNPGSAAQRCSSGNTTMEFVFHSGLVSGQAVAAPPVVLPPPPPTIAPPPGSPPIITIPDTPDVDPVTPGTPAMPPPAAPPPVLPPPVAPPGSPPPPVAPPPTFNPPPPPVTPPGVVCSPPSPWVEYDNQVPNCAVNQYGVRTQRRSRNVSYSCPEAWDNPETTLGPWSSWADVTNTCTACPVLAPESQTQWLAFTGSCPVGQIGTLSHEYEQRRTRTRGHNCPAGTTVLPPISTGAWSGWSNTGSTRNSVNTCTPTCSAPAPNSTPISRPAPPQTRDTCPAGYTGSTPQIRTGTEAGTRTTTWTCPAPTGSATSTTADSWSGTYTYGGWAPNGPNTCVAPPACTAPSPSTAPISRPASNENRDAGCPAGQTGQHLQTRTRTENGTRTTSWTCPGPTSTSSDSWSGTYTPGPWTTTSNTCVPVGPPPNNGICPSRPMVTGCATYSVSTRARVTPISIGEDNGAGFSTPGQYVRCTVGYADTIGADGFPSIAGENSRYRLVERGGCGMDWEAEYGIPEECSSYVRVYARNADGTNGQQCFGEAKIIFNWDSK